MLALTLGSKQAGMKDPQEGWASLTKLSDLTAVPDLGFLYLPGCCARDLLEVGGATKSRAFRGDCFKTSSPDTISFASAAQLPPSSVVKIPRLFFLLIPPVLARSSSTHTLSTTHQLQHSSVKWNYIMLEFSRAEIPGTLNKKWTQRIKLVHELDPAAAEVKKTFSID